MGNIVARVKWIFGTQEAFAAGRDLLPSRGSASNVLGSTGAGAVYNCHSWGESYTFYVEADGGATGSYQIRSARTSSGPWAVLSSGTLSTSQCDVVQLPGPFKFVSPRVKTLNSTANQIAIEMIGVEA